MELALFLMLVKFAPFSALYTIVSTAWNSLQEVVAFIILWITVTDKTKIVPVYKIIYRHKFRELDAAKGNDFIWLFWGTMELEVLRNRASVQQYSLDDRRIYFVETDPKVAVHSSNISPFVFAAQFNYAKKIYSITHEQFHQLASALMKPDVQVLLLSNTGRCGSTLITQMFEATASSFCLSEPDSLTSVRALQANNKMSTYQIRKLLESIFVMYVQSTALHGVKVAFIKPRSMCHTLVPLIHKQVPWVRHLFMYRGGLATIKSCFLSCSLDPFIIYATSHPDKIRQLIKSFSLDFIGSIEDIDGVFTTCARVWIRSLSDVRKYQRDLHIAIPTLKYEDLLKEPDQHMKAINDEFGFNFNDTELGSALDATKKDSQCGLTISRKNVYESGTHKAVDSFLKEQYTDSVKARLDALCKREKVPSLESNDRAEGAIMTMQ